MSHSSNVTARIGDSIINSSQFSEDPFIAMHRDALTGIEGFRVYLNSLSYSANTNRIETDFTVAETPKPHDASEVFLSEKFINEYNASNALVHDTTRGVISQGYQSCTTAIYKRMLVKGETKDESGTEGDKLVTIEPGTFGFEGDKPRFLKICYQLAEPSVTK